MITVIREEKKNSNVTKYGLKERENGLILSFSTYFNGEIVEKELDLDFDTYRDQIFSVSLQNANDKAEVNITPLYGMTTTRYEQRDSRNGSKTLARVSISDDAMDVTVFLMDPSDEIEGVRNVLFSGTETISGAMCNASAYYKSRHDAAEEKYGLTRKLDVYDTVTYLESQVDALTRLVLKLVNEDTAARRILQTADTYSVLDIKDELKIMAEIASDKRNVRELQRSYYEKKAGT